MVESYRDLKVWQRSIEMTLSVYRVTAEFPRDELFGLTSQMRRAGVSVSSNIAEGYGRNSTGEYKQFLGVARGSNLELQTQLVIATRLSYSNSAGLAEAEGLSNEVAKMLNSSSVNCRLMSTIPYSLLRIPCSIDILAIAAHRDDVEQTCGGTLLAMHAKGWTTGILDLTQGESGTRGTAQERASEAARAAAILNVSHREALDLPDGNVQNTLENRLKIAAVLRRLRPRVVILPYWQGRHPDHYTTATLGYEACFVSGLAKVTTPGAPYAPHRPYKILYASLYADVRPSFVVDITPFAEQRFQSLMAYTSQYATQAEGSGIFVDEEQIRETTFATARHYGLLAGVRYAEPFVQKEVGLVDDLMLLPVASL